MRHHCIACGTEFPVGFNPLCATCGGMVDVEYALDKVQLVDSPNPYIRFAGLLPLTAFHESFRGAVYTPMIHATRLGHEVGMPFLYLKNETVLPTRTTKDRMAVVSLAYLHERGVRSFCASSTGNSGTAFAYAIQSFPDMFLFLFTAERFVPRVQYADHGQVTHFGMRGASFVEAASCATNYASVHGLVSESGFFNPARREGLKLSFLEASEQVGQPIDFYVQSVSSGMGVYGAYKGAKELRHLDRLTRLPSLLCVQQETCAPMANAFAEGSEAIRPEHLVTNPTGIAEAILRGDPTRAYPHLRRIVIESGGDFVSVTEDEIRTARRRVEECEAISPCFSASAAVAGIIKFAASGKVSREAVIVVNLTGGDRPDDRRHSNIDWIQRTPNGWSARAPSEDSQPI